MAEEIKIDADYLSGQILIAMPGMTDERFERSVIYLCAHNEDGAMGLVLNRPIEALTFPDLLEQLNIADHDPSSNINVHFGGPVDTARGFVLHTPDYVRDSTMVVDEHFAMTTTVDILRAIAQGRGPKKRLLALGYAGWGPGQLDQEILKNGWLSVAADDALVFGADTALKWNQAMDKLGIDPRLLSEDVGHA